MSDAVCLEYDIIMTDNIVDIHIINSIHNIEYCASTDSMEVTCLNCKNV